MPSSQPQDHRRALARLHRAALGDLGERDAAWLAGHLRWCASCRAAFDQQVGVDRELARIVGVGPLPLLPLERVVARAAVLEAAGTPPPGLLRAISWRWWAGLSAAIALALLVLLLWPALQRSISPRPGVDRDFAPRGGSAVALRLFCVDPLAMQFRPAQQPDAGARCQLRESLKVTYLNTSRAHRYLWVLGLDEKLEIKWYYPTPGASSGVAIGVARTLAPLPDMITLAVNHRPGLVRVFGIFSSEKISGAQIQAAVQQLRARRATLRSLKGLPLSVPAEQLVSNLQIVP